MPFICQLPNRGMLRLQGEDVCGFLQGLISNDIEKLIADTALYAALLTPQGKYLYDFMLYQLDESILMDAETHRLPDLKKRLNMYRLRRPINIDDVSNQFAVYALWGEDISSANPEYAAYPDPRSPALGYRLLCKYGNMESVAQAMSATTVPFEQYDQLRIRHFIPDGSRDMTPEGTFLLENGFEALNGVDFNKGCYVGQEVTARSKYRGNVKKCLALVETTEPSLPEPGTAITIDGTTIGEMRSSSGNIGLALVKIATVDANGKANAGNTPVMISLPE